MYLLVAWPLFVAVLAKLARFLPLFWLTWVSFVGSSGVCRVRCICGITILWGGRWMSVSYFVVSFFGWAAGLGDSGIVFDPELVGVC